MLTMYGFLMFVSPPDAFPSNYFQTKLRQIMAKVSCIRHGSSRASHGQRLVAHTINWFSQLGNPNLNLMQN